MIFAWSITIKTKNKTINGDSVLYHTHDMQSNPNLVDVEVSHGETEQMYEK